MTRSEMLEIAKPILFNTQMVIAVDENRKTQTRRLITPQPKGAFCLGYCSSSTDKHREGAIGWANYEASPSVLEWRKPKYQLGDYLYVRETWQEGHDGYIFKANFPKELLYEGWKWKPSIHMPKEAARIFLKVTGVRVERLRKISPEDAVAEGAVQNPHYTNWGGERYLALHARYRDDFAVLWDGTITPKDLAQFGWAANPWVWVYEFERVIPEGL